MFTISDPDMALFSTFGEKLQAKIKSAPEWTRDKPIQKAGLAKSGFDDMDDDIPF
jgi:hypothetical protein